MLVLFVKVFFFFEFVVDDVEGEIEVGLWFVGDELDGLLEHLFC
jgi:hypothetical protein